MERLIMAEGEKRITLLVSEELYERLNASVPHGYRKHLLAAVIDTVLKAIEDDGEMLIGALMARQFKLVRDDH